MPRGHEVPPWVFPPITPPPRAVPEQWLGWCLGGSLAPRDGQWLAALGGECVGLGGGGPGWVWPVLCLHGAHRLPLPQNPSLPSGGKATTERSLRR